MLAPIRLHPHCWDTSGDTTWPATARDSRLESRSARLRLPIRRKPYNGPGLARGVVLQYRRNRHNGSWVLKASDGHGKYWTKAFAEADDFDESDGTESPDVLRGASRRQDAGARRRRGGHDGTGHRRRRAGRLQARSHLARRRRLQRRSSAAPSNAVAAVQAGGAADDARAESLARRAARQDRACLDQPNLQRPLRGPGTGTPARPAHPEPRRMGNRPCRPARRAARAQCRSERRASARLRRRRLSARSGARPFRRRAGRNRRAAKPSAAPAGRGLAVLGDSRSS